MADCSDIGRCSKVNGDWLAEGGCKQARDPPDGGIVDGRSMTTGLGVRSGSAVYGTQNERLESAARTLERGWAGAPWMRRFMMCSSKGR